MSWSQTAALTSTNNSPKSSVFFQVDLLPFTNAELLRVYAVSQLAEKGLFNESQLARMLLYKHGLRLQTKLEKLTNGLSKVQD